MLTAVMDVDALADQTGTVDLGRTGQEHSRQHNFSDVRFMFQKQGCSTKSDNNSIGI